MNETRANAPAEQLTADLDVARELLCRVRTLLDAGTLTDDELLCVAASAAEVGQACGSIDVAVAGEVAERSRRQLGGERLCARKGCRNAVELVQRISRVSSATAAKLLRVGEAVRPVVSLTGQSLPARFSTLGSVLSTAGISVDAANAIVTGLSVSSLKADPATIAAAEVELVRAALGESLECPVPATADDLRLQAAVWRSVIDPDGVEPDEERAMRHRSLTLGRATSAGVPLSGMLLPEAAARLQRIFDAYLSPVTSPVAFPALRGEADARGAAVAGDAADTANLGAAADADAEAADPRSSEIDGESARDAGALDVAVEGRSRPQQQHDVFLSMIESASRAADTPSIGGAPATVMVSVRESDLAAGTGVGWVDGCEVPLSARTVRQLVCSGGVQRVILSDEGRVVQLGGEQRCFTGRQRRAITLRDGGCIIPGCSVPASWCEIHHVDEHSGGGPTHSDNGVLLCWFHHRTIDQSGWEIRMRSGVPQIKAPPWIDRRHRRWAPSTKSRTRLAQELVDRPHRRGA
ncbi:HNH endonuclease signature motif containing protein [Subtercola endophyticus]|uniref:HNH endonuclease signature motif containing protein n=1 Tax=Subtercola endophyticus TaxID=2895559 RepID=UPI001E45C6A9|nr:HNH endonuclease signature motif containing protein [Subtercola endophyticus]UFS59812.1 HNH endonuclease [Subtercola endophyticus]